MSARVSAARGNHSGRLRAHDTRRLAHRWKAIARKARMRCETFARVDGHELFYLEGRATDRPALYLSAGIHGDEPAAVEALAEWAEASAAFLRDMPVLIFPCLNPWGLLNNCRFDAAGRDLNRCYDARPGPRLIAAHRRCLNARRFGVAMMLHEDYDARGAYLYEVRGRRPFLGELLLAAAARHIALESRRMVEGRPCRGGLIRRRVTPGMLPGEPEALYLHFHYQARVLTFETPSEFAIDQRVEAHLAVLDRLAGLAFAC